MSNESWMRVQALGTNSEQTWTLNAISSFGCCSEGGFGRPEKPEGNGRKYKYSPGKV
jgi:hypothetical protein